MRRARATAILLFGAVLILCRNAGAQGGVTVARATSVSGHAMLSAGNGTPAFALTREYVLNPGDQVDTRGGGRVVIDLSDGSMVIVQPESVIVLKDFRAASSLRELFEIMLGRVLVKINHFGGRPNPYRMNSPTASIAVRGTQFSISVDSQGDTQVEVYEGAVEVASLTDPDRKVLIEAGRGVLVRPGQNFHFISSPAGRDFDGHGQASNHDQDHGQRSAASVHPDSHSEESRDRDQTSPRAAASTYERYIASLSEVGQVPFLLRYNAFPEAHLDSLENPAYATGFQSAEGRIFFVPSLSGVQGLPESAPAFAPGGAPPVDYSLSPQFSVFVPIKGSRFVMGGSLTASRFGNGVQASSPDFDPGLFNHNANGALLRTTGSSTSSFFSASVLAAWRFGAGNSLGVAVESLKGTGVLSNTTLDPEPPAITSVEEIGSSSSISQTRTTIGFERDLTRNHKLGLFYRYGLIDARDGQRSHTIDGILMPLDTTRTSGHSSEFGARLRGPISPRLFYGVEASWMGLSLNDGLQRAGVVDSHQRDRARRYTLGAGLGYMLTQRTVLSFDLAGGDLRARIARTEDVTGALLQTGNNNSRFVSVHGAVQTDLTRHFLVSASFLAVRQSDGVGFTLYPDQFGNKVPIMDSFLPFAGGIYRPASHFSDLGAGWRFSRNFFAQYVYSTDYGYSFSSHTLMLRYTFHFHAE